MGLLADMKRFRMAATPTISSKAICTIRTKGTAMTTALSRWLNEEILRVGCLLTLVSEEPKLSQVDLNDLNQFLRALGLIGGSLLAHPTISIGGSRQGTARSPGYGICAGSAGARC